MPSFKFETTSETRTQEIGEPTADSRLLELTKTNSVPPLLSTKKFSYSVAAGRAIINLSETDVEKSGWAGFTLSQVSAVRDFAHRSQITSNFVDLIAVTASLSQRANMNALKKALLEILESQLVYQDLNKEFNADASAEFVPSTLSDGVPAEGGNVKVLRDFVTRRMITNDELTKTYDILMTAIVSGDRIRFSESECDQHLNN